MEKLKMHSPDLTKRNIDKIAELFPAVVTEGCDDDGNSIRVIDFDLLRQELIGQVIEGPQERYQLDWPGKRQAMFAANAPIAKTLRPVREESVDFDTTQNLFIEGDNLDALKLLQESYLGKIKLIYIDPPYNTGNDFVYNDDLSETTDEYLAKSGQIDVEGNRLVANTESNGRFHSDWLSMMYPRLKLARNLLTESGVAFISIGREELSNLRLICGETFGERNIVATFSREQKSGSNLGDFIAPQLDYVIACARNVEALMPFVVPIAELEKEVEKSLFQSSLDPLRGCVNQRYWIECPDGSFVIPPGDLLPEDVSDGGHIPPASRNDKVWRWSYASYLGQKNELRFKKTGRGTLMDEHGNPSPWNVFTVKRNTDSQMRPRDYIFSFTNSAGSAELKELGMDWLFDNPKPAELVQYLIRFVQGSEDAIILDFFAGSGTTAQAVLQTNHIDGGNRRFIMVQINEPVDPESDAAKQGFTTISELAKERVRRAGSMIAKDAVLSAQELDVGFRVLSVDTTNMSDVMRIPDDLTQDELDIYTDNVKPDRTGEDLLFQVLLEWGLELSMPITADQIDNRDVFVVEDGALIACFADSVSPAVIREIATREPLRAVFLDSGFATDADRINAEQVFAEISPATEVKAI